MGLVLDYASRQISPSAIRDFGAEGVIGYVADPRVPSLAAKPITADYAQRLRDAGLEVASNFQYGKPQAPFQSDFRRKFAGGVADAERAAELHAAAGGGDDDPIYFSVDEEINVTDWNNTAADWFRGINSVIGTQRTGIYGGAGPCWWAVEDGLVGRSTTLGKFWLWQTKAWSNGARVDEAALYQRVVDTVSSPGPLIDGTRVDVSDTLAADWGQWSLDRSAGVVVPPLPAIDITDYRPGAAGRYNGYNSRKRIYVHTSEGKDWESTARGTADYQISSQTGSYHYLIDDNEIICTVPDTDTAWAVLSDNSNSLNICLILSSGRSGYGPTARETDPKPREDWLQHVFMMSALAYLVRMLADKWNVPIEWVDANGVGRDRHGISSHNAYTYGSSQLMGFKDGSHWDIPPTFPSDVLIEMARNGSVDPDNDPAWDAVKRAVGLA
jgi:hypothetical protein